MVLRALCVPIFFVTRRTQTATKNTKRAALVAISGLSFQEFYVSF